MNTLLLRTTHGSRLYGLNHANSDEDWFEVYGWDKSKSRQKIAGAQDVLRCSLDSFLWNCNRGVPQFLEAMFSTQCEVNEIPFITEAYRPGLDNTRITYKRTIKKLWLKGVEEKKIKFRKHAVRMLLNLNTLEKTGRFNPELTPIEKSVVAIYCYHDTLDDVEEALDKHPLLV
jgi:hypothetical protein